MGRHRARRGAPPPWQFYVDVVGGCNLRCPSCPVGNSSATKTSKGYMKPELLAQIAEKARAECGPDTSFGLFNWTEPFLHPNLPAMIRAVKDRGLSCGLSSNLNLLEDVDEVLAAQPDHFRVSISAFAQERYGTTHVDGEIETVRRNMERVAAAKRKARASTRLELAFHRYLGNHVDEAAVRAFAEPLGFKFSPNWAYLMPLEKVLAVADPSLTDVVITDADRALMAKLALPVEQALEAGKRAALPDCRLRDRQMALDCKGNVFLCCAAFDPAKYALGTYLALPLAEIQGLKNTHSQCGSCMEAGVHAVFMYGSREFDGIARENVRKHFPELDVERAFAEPGRGNRLARASRRLRERLFARAD